MAERVGFEPTVGFPTSVFKTDAIDHSATSPRYVMWGVLIGVDDWDQGQIHFLSTSEITQSGREKQCPREERCHPLKVMAMGAEA